MSAPVLLNPSIVIIDVDCRLPEDEVIKAAAALQRQVREHVAPLWGLTATVRAATSTAPPHPKEWQLQLLRTPTQADALGYHDEKPDGTPILYVFPELCAQDGTSWTSCASHEIAEAIVDPLLGDIKMSADGKLWACEVADACESQSYEIDGVAVSDFCTPAWFSPPTDVDGVMYDFLGKCTKDHQILDGGYGQVYDPQAGWQMQGTMRPYRSALRAMKFGRGAKRARRTP